MSTPINIPKLGMSMMEGTLVEWLVEDGQHVEAGQALYLVETDKVENEIESPASGRLVIVAEAGETFEVGTEVGRIE